MGNLNFAFVSSFDIRISNLTKLSMNFLKHHHHKLYLAPLALVVTHMVWGASSPVFKWALEDISPFTLAFLRFFLATLILLPFTIHQIRVRIKDLGKLFLLGFVGFTLHIGLLFVGLSKTSSINVPIIASSAPVMLILASMLILREKVKPKILYGTLISLLGVGVIMMRPFLDNGLDGTFVGNLFVVASIVAFVIYTILLKEFQLKYSAVTMLFWMFAIAAITFFPFFFVETFPSVLVPRLTPQSAFGILFGAVFTSVIAYGGYNYAVKHMHVNQTGVFSYLAPIVAILTAVPLLGEHVTPTYIIGSILVFAGIFIAEIKLHHHPKH